MTWKAKFATTHCERLCPARIIVSPLGHWPATQVFPGRDPCNSSWTTCVPLCPQNLNNQRIIYNSLFIPGLEWSLFVRIRNICTWCVQIIHHLKVHNVRWKNIRTSPGIIHIWPKILIPDPKSSGSSNNSRICPYASAPLPNYIYQIVYDKSGFETDPSNWLIL